MYVRGVKDQEEMLVTVAQMEIHIDVVDEQREIPHPLPSIDFSITTFVQCSVCMTMEGSMYITYCMAAVMLQSTLGFLPVAALEL